MLITATQQFGPIQENFSIDFPQGYSVLVGENDTGKSAILQLTFKKVLNEMPEYGNSAVCIISPDRIFVDGSTETRGRTLEQHNSEFFTSIGGNLILPYENIVSPPKSELPKLLLTHDDFITQIDYLKAYLSRLGIANVVLRRSQEVTFEDVHVIFHGSGLRSIFSILAALTDPKIKVLLIDEPELSLEPKLQKSLRDLLYDLSKEKIIIVSTHSHLFINRRSLASNFIVEKNINGVSATPLSTEKQLNNLVFNLLGNSLDDLFFPRNFLIVEGSSDQVIVEKAIEVLGVQNSKIKVIAAGGINNVTNIYNAIKNTLVPLEMHDSPYAKKAVVMVDKPRVQNDLRDLKSHLKDRLFKLNTSSIEDYVPEDLYSRIGKVKNDEIAHIKTLEGRQVELNIYKTTLSNAIASALNQEDLDKMPIIKKAINKAAS